MVIAVIGAGKLGKALGLAWRDRGYDVCFGVRHQSDPKNASVLPGKMMEVRAATAAADVVVLATPWPATEAAVRAASGLAGKLVLDCTNPLAMGADGLGLAVGFEISGAEKVQSWARGASVFKTFNQIGAENMPMAEHFPVKPVMFVCGDDEVRKPEAMALVSALKFEAFDAGPLGNARLLEPYAMLWIDLAFNRGLGREFGFALIRRSPT
jgi:hypothetical protein